MGKGKGTFEFWATRCVVLSCRSRRFADRLSDSHLVPPSVVSYSRLVVCRFVKSSPETVRVVPFLCRAVPDLCSPCPSPSPSCRQVAYSDGIHQPRHPSPPRKHAYLPTKTPGTRCCSHRGGISNLDRFCLSEARVEALCGHLSYSPSR
mgnify:CR=1 FL=1